MTNPLFADQADIEDNAPDQGETNDYAAELIGEGKKYKDLSAAAKALIEKDRFIERLKAENAEARASLKGEAKMDEFLSKLQQINSGTASTSANPQGETATNQNYNNNETPSKALTVDEVQKLLEDRERAAAEKRNLEASIQMARDAFGANYKVVMTQKAEELGMSQEYLLNLAKTQPKAFAKLVEADAAPQGRTTAPSTSVNTAALNTKRAGEKNNEYYKTLRKQIGDAEFFKPSIQNQLHKDAQRLGPAFFS